MPANTRVETIMTKEVFTVELEDTLRQADEIMRNEKVHHVPVLDNSKLVGMITSQTLMEFTLKKLYDYEEEAPEEGYNKIIDFQEVMLKNVFVIYPEDSLLKAIELMTKKHIECLPVVDWSYKVVGILTSLDILLFIRKSLIDELKK